MSQLPRRVVAIVLSAFLVIMVMVQPAFAQDDALDAALDAIGGADALAGLSEFVVKSSGARGTLDEGQMADGRAGLGGTFISLATIDIAGGRLRLDYQIAATELSPPRSVVEVIVGDVGYIDGQDSIAAPPGPVPMLSDRMVSIRTHQQLLNPPLLLLDVLADPSLATLGPDSVEIAHGPTPITLWLGADGRIARATTMERDPAGRGVQLVASYAFWGTTGSGVLFPGTVSITYDGELVHEEARTASTDSIIDPASFEIPGDVEPTFDPELAARGDINHQYLQSFAAIGFPLDGQ